MKGEEPIFAHGAGTRLRGASGWRVHRAFGVCLDCVVARQRWRPAAAAGRRHALDGGLLHRIASPPRGGMRSASTQRVDVPGVLGRYPLGPARSPPAPALTGRLAPLLPPFLAACGLPGAGGGAAQCAGRPGEEDTPPGGRSDEQRQRACGSALAALPAADKRAAWRMCSLITHAWPVAASRQRGSGLQLGPSQPQVCRPARLLAARPPPAGSL